MPPTASPAPPIADGDATTDPGVEPDSDPVAGPATTDDPGLAQAKAILLAQVAADPVDADSMALLADLHADEADRAATEHWLRAAVAAGPARLDLRLLLARFLIDQARPGEAVTLLRADAETTPAHPELLLVYGTAQLAAGTLESAWQVARRAAAARPDDFRSQYLLARTEMAVGQSAAAVATLDRVLAIAPALHLARRDLVAMLLASGDPDRGATEIAPLQRAMPGDAGVALLAGQVALAQDDLQQARDRLREAHAGGAGREALLALARTEARLDDLPAATVLYRDWLANNPDDTGVRLALANALVVADDRSAAAAEWERVLDTDPENLLALNNLAYSLRESDPARGLDLAERAYAQAEDVAAVADTYATLQAANGDFTLAERTLARALDRHPEAHGLRLHRAELLLQDDRDEAARDQLALLLRLPEDAPERTRAAVLLAGLDGESAAGEAATR